MAKIISTMLDWARGIHAFSGNLAAILTSAAAIMGAALVAWMVVFNPAVDCRRADLAFNEVEKCVFDGKHSASQDFLVQYLGQRTTGTRKFGMPLTSEPHLVADESGAPRYAVSAVLSYWGPMIDNARSLVICEKVFNEQQSAQSYQDFINARAENEHVQFAGYFKEVGTDQVELAECEIVLH